MVLYGVVLHAAPGYQREELAGGQVKLLATSTQLGWTK